MDEQIREEEIELWKTWNDEPKVYNFTLKTIDNFKQFWMQSVIKWDDETYSERNRYNGFYVEEYLKNKIQNHRVFFKGGT